jgi:hypothetical protein
MVLEWVVLGYTITAEVVMLLLLTLPTSSYTIH